MANSVNANLPQDKRLATKVIDNNNALEKAKLEMGWLGRVWGNHIQLPSNVAGFIIILLILTGILYTACSFTLKPEEISLSVKDFWSIISPIITLSIGYLFGEKAKKDDS